MPAEIIFPEGIKGSDREIFQRMMALIPAAHRNEKELQRLIAFRLKVDGEDLTRAYLLKKIEHARECQYKGSLYDFIKDDKIESACGVDEPDPPDLIG